MPAVNYASLSPDVKKIVDPLLATIAGQADRIGHLTELLSGAEGTMGLQSSILGGPTLVALAAKLQSPPVNGVTRKDMNEAIAKMQQDVTSAKDAQQIFSSIFAFALKVLPLALA